MSLRVSWQSSRRSRVWALLYFPRAQILPGQLPAQTAMARWPPSLPACLPLRRQRPWKLMQMPLHQQLAAVLESRLLPRSPTAPRASSSLRASSH